MEYSFAIRYFAKAIYPEQILPPMIPNNIHHRLIKTRNNKRYYLLKKNLPYISAREECDKVETIGESINLNDLQYCVKINVDKICFIYPNRKIYWISPLDMEDWGNVRGIESTGEVTCTVDIKHLRRLE